MISVVGWVVSTDVGGQETQKNHVNSNVDEVEPEAVCFPVMENSYLGNVNIQSVFAFQS